MITVPIESFGVSSLYIFGLKLLPDLSKHYPPTKNLCQSPFVIQVYLENTSLGCRHLKVSKGALRLGVGPDYTLVPSVSVLSNSHLVICF